MATYDKLIYDIPPYQEGNKADFEFDLDTNFPIDQVSDITFQVRKNNGDALISRKKSDASDELTLVDRTVTIRFAPEDTIGRVGTHLYEIDFVNLEGHPFATIGGKFIINAQINNL